MVWEFIKLVGGFTIRRVWIADYTKNGEEYFGLYDNAELLEYYTLREHAIEGLEARAEGLIKEGFVPADSKNKGREGQGK
jgi:hypothetical protein